MEGNGAEKPKRKKTGGRTKGTPNRYSNTRVLKEAVLIAAEMEGDNGKGRGGLIGYLRTMAQEDRRAFASLLRGVMPLQLESKSDFRFDVTYRSSDEIRREMASRGITKEAVIRLLDGPATIDGEVVDAELIDE